MTARLHLLQDLSENIRASGRRPTPGGTLSTLLTVRYLATVLFRVAQLVGRTSAVGASMVKQLNHVLTGADVAWQATVADGLVLFHPTGVVLGPHVRVGRNCHVQAGVTIGGDGGTRGGAGVSPMLGDEVRVGAGARVFGPVTVGDRSRIGANAVVTKSFPDDSVLVGVPARLTR